ncbi:MAG: heavy metal translocating P-type ATPase [Gammaproteobacteria bacterium]
MASAPGACFHCGEPLTGREPWTVRLEDADRPVCCPGCKAVAEFIRDTGLADYYEYRTAPGLKPAPELDDTDAQWLAFDRPELLEQVSSPLGDDRRECSLLVEGVRCAACSWLIEKSLGSLPGVTEARVNPATARARLVWDPARVRLSRLLSALSRLGYRPHPGGAASAEIAEAERRRALRRLGVAGLGMMQVMMFAVALYAGAFQQMDEGLERFLRLVSMAVATPVVLYSGFPFFAGAARDIRAGRPGMDVPVAIAVGGAWVASVFHVLSGQGEVYFDSVTMFVFFLSLGRFLEMGARHRAGDTRDSLARLLPDLARRRAGGDWEDVPVRELAAGDRVLVRHGETVPADGRVSGSGGRFDESMLTGESRPVQRRDGDMAVAGSVNLGEPVEVLVERTGGDMLVSSMARLLERAQAERPPVALAADRVARWFVTSVLLAAAGVYLYWLQAAPDRAFEITLAVLVVTCPCALSLATPAALTAATNFLARHGLLVTRGAALERLAGADYAVFDKTGTLTRGRLRVVGVHPVGNTDPDRALALAAALERASEHPVARAFRDIAPAGEAKVSVVPGQGLEGHIAGTDYRLGRPDFAAALSGVTPPVPESEATVLLLADRSGPLALIEVADDARHGTARDLAALRDLGLALEIASGDREMPVAAVAATAGVECWAANQSPEAKLARIRRLQGEGHTVVMVGDGVNDAPVLAGADVSVAMGGGTALAQTSADLVLLGDTLGPLPLGVRIARKTRRVILENLAWAAGYNLVALPLAAIGLIQPWMAAIGMSASSLLVVLNALRLSRDPAPAGPQPATLAGEAGA